ncbi:hypothetical protein ACQP1V_42685 (plasmid) [Microtetraspora malaysiensis]|uniref:hypothetical protein n=1 Tax=Microtetraspora malaysiensis TaxID=161358 RepID=UPI003D8FBC17
MQAGYLSDVQTAPWWAANATLPAGNNARTWAFYIDIPADYSFSNLYFIVSAGSSARGVFQAALYDRDNPHLPVAATPRDSKVLTFTGLQGLPFDAPVPARSTPWTATVAFLMHDAADTALVGAQSDMLADTSLPGLSFYSGQDFLPIHFDLVGFTGDVRVPIVALS